jgi:hypothetical protein
MSTFSTAQVDRLPLPRISSCLDEEKKGIRVVHLL